LVVSEGFYYVESRVIAIIFDASQLLMERACLSDSRYHQAGAMPRRAMQQNDDGIDAANDRAAEREIQASITTQRSSCHWRFLMQ
jgi:hypothetical protein